MFPRNGFMTIVFLTVSLCLFGVTAPLLAAEPQNKTGQKSFFEMSLEELMEVPVTTGASRPINRDKMPASVTVITADEIKLLGLRNLTDVINYIVPGGIGDIHRSTRTGLYCFRGITADDNGKYVFMVDGLNVTSMTMWGAFNERYLGLLDELDRIEITQGVSSNLYGDGATSGIINFITKTGRDFQGTQITSGYGSDNDFQESIKFGSKKSPTENDFYYFGYKQSHGFTPSGGSGSSTSGEGRKEHSADGRYWNHFPPSFKFQSTIQRGEFTLRSRYVNEKFEEPYTAPGFDYWNTSDVYWFHQYFFIQPEILHTINEVSRIKANIALEMEEMGQEKFKDWYYPSAGGNLIAKAGEDYITRGEKKIRSQLFHYYDGFANHKLTTGAELFWMHVGSDFSGRNRTITVASGNRVDIENIKPNNLYYGALLAEDIWQLNSRTTLFAGARLEKHNLTSLSFSPRIAISHDLSEKTNLKFLYNSGYRTPPWGYFASNEKSLTPKPKPEKVQSFEAHILHKFNPKFNASLTGYYTIYKDLINYWSTSFGAPISSYYNFPEVKAAGLEALGEYHSENLTLKVSHSYSRAVHLSEPNAWKMTILSYNEHDWAQFPTHLTKAQAIIPLIKDKCTLGLTYLRPWGIRGQRNADPKLKDAADYINATLTFKLNKNFELQVSGYNLTSEDHPWWGAYTYDGVSRDINPNPTYFVRLIGTF